MTRPEMIFVPHGEDTARDILKLVVMAVGGQGGGVLTNWIEHVARAEGRAVQATSVAGVAQRTGATIYYVEIAPENVSAPVFSLAPAAGDVDVLIAAEMMEAGRAIQRGFVTPDRTVLIASTHRALAVSEKTVPGDGMADAQAVEDAAKIAAKSFVSADYERAAVACGSVISASLLGALAGSGALPFPVERFEEAIRASGRSVEASLAAFSAGMTASKDDVAPVETVAAPVLTGPEKARAEWDELVRRAAALPAPARDMTLAGLRKVVEFMDAGYGAEYLEKVEYFAAHDSEEKGFDLTVQAAKYIANAMAYDDVIRVADRKIRGARQARIERDMAKRPEQLLSLTEYFHPRAEEIVGLMPGRLGARLEGSPKWMARIDRWFGKGRRIRSDRLGGFLMLYLLGGLKGYRRRTLRHRVEMDHILRWLDRVRQDMEKDYAVAVEILKCRRLVKGYSDTHARGLSKFDRVLDGADLVAGRSDAADWIRRLRESALADEKGQALDGALDTIRSFST